MKKISALIITLLMLFSLSITSLAYELPITKDAGLLISPSPDQELLVSLKNGVVPKRFVEDIDDLLSYLDIIDNSDQKILSRKLTHFFDFIPEYYYGEITKNDLFEALMSSNIEIDINNMDPVYTVLFDALDNFSYYLSAEEAQAFFAPTASRGIGIKMMWKDDEGLTPGIYVTDVADGSSAKEVGILKGDRLVGFDGYDVSGLALQALSPIISSIPDERAFLTVKLERNGTVTEYALERRVCLFDEYEIELFEEEKLIYLTINSFMYSTTATKISVALDSLYSKGFRDIIVDLTENSGGDVFVAAEILSKFTPEKNAPLFYMGRDGNRFSLAFNSLGNGHVFDSVKILVDETTASSAEIFAYSLQELVGAKVIGTLTFGKGVAQVTSSFIDGTACGITTYVAYNQKGETYNEKGIVPDEHVVGKIERNSIGTGIPTLTYLNFTKAKEGEVNKQVLGLEKRLQALGYLSPLAVDETWDTTTTLALTSLQKTLGLEETGALDENTYFGVMNLVKTYENTWSYTFTSRDYALRKYKIFE